MFSLLVDPVDVAILRRIILTYATDLENSEARLEAEDHTYAKISEKGYRFIDYAQQLGKHAKEGAQ